MTRSYSNPQDDEVRLGNFKPIQSRFSIEELRSQIAQKDGIWSAQPEPPHIGPSPPTDTSRLWFDDRKTPYIQNVYNGAQWIPATPDKASELTFADGRTVESQQGRMLEPGQTRGLEVRDSAIYAVGDGGYERKFLSVYNTVPTLYDGNVPQVQVQGYGKLYAQRVDLWVPAATYADGDYLDFVVDISDYTTVAMTNIVGLVTTAVAKEWRSYELRDGREFESGRYGDLKRLNLRLSPTYPNTWATSKNVQVEIIIVGWR